MDAKRIAAERAVTYVTDGMNVGLGTGSTAAYAIHALGRRVREEGLSIRCIATSRASRSLAMENKIPLCDWDHLRRFDVTIDGADEVDPEFRLVKGGGGALVREKIVAAATDMQIIIVDPTKLVPALGAHAVPAVVLPFGWQATRDRIETTFRCPTSLRKAADGSPFMTDDSLLIVDLHFAGAIPDIDTFEARLKAIVGVAECGLFNGLCHRVIVGHDDGRVDELTLSR